MRTFRLVAAACVPVLLIGYGMSGDANHMTAPPEDGIGAQLSMRNAVRDAGLKVKDVDGIFTAGQHSPATLGEALGLKPRYVDGTTVGGCSFIIMVGHAVAALHHGLCDVAVVSHGESGRSGTGVTSSRDTALSGQFEFPYGFGGATSYFGMITTRHMHEHGTTLEQWAQVAVSTRKWAALNPKARFRDPITVADVLSSRPVSYPFNLLNICLVTDAGGAVVLTRADRAKDCAKPPVYVGRTLCAPRHSGVPSASRPPRQDRPPPFSQHEPIFFPTPPHRAAVRCGRRAIELRSFRTASFSEARRKGATSSGRALRL